MNRAWHSPRTPHPRRIPGFDPASAGMLMWLGRIIGPFSIGAFVLLANTRGIPTNIEAAGWEQPAQLALLGVVTFGYGLAWWREGIGSALMIIGGVGLGIFASLAYEPSTAFFAALAFVIPGLLFALHWQWHSGVLRLGGMLASVAVVLAIGGVAADRTYDHYFGPTHPESSVELPDVDLVEWVWAGGVTSDGFTVVAELEGDTEANSLVVSTDADLTGGTTVVGQLTGPLERPIFRYEVTGLEPGTEYHYAVAVNVVLDTGRRGSLTTFPEGEADFTVALGACLQTGSDGQVFDRIRELDPLLMLITGDFHYENLGSEDPEDHLESYIDNLTSPAQESLYLQTPVQYSWDDHDYGGNNSNAFSPSREAVQEAYESYVPHYPLPSEDGAIYTAYSVGRVRFIVTDHRSNRIPAGEPDGPTMLGDEQLAWLKAELFAAHEEYALTVWVNGVPWIDEPDPLSDTWGGFAEEREEIANFIATSGIDRLVMLSGDAHMVAIDDGSNSDYSEIGEAGFPILHAAALDRVGSYKGGPYSEGAIPGGGQFGTMSVDDQGDTIHVTLTGRNWEGEELLRYEFSYAVPPDV